MSHLGFLLLGLGSGAAYAALAMALVVTYRSSSVINFSISGIAVYGAYVFAFARKGQFVPMVPGLPSTVDLPWDLSFFPALALALALSAFLGLLIYGLVFRPLRTAPPVARVVASVSLLLGLVLLISKQMGSEFVPVSGFFPEGRIKVGATIANWEQIWTAISIVAVAAALAVLFRYTRFGLMTRAVAESEVGAYVSRVPATRVAALNWMLSGAVAGFAGIIVAPLVAVVPMTYALFIVPALVAAVVARFENIGVAVAVGLGLGAIGAESLYLSRTQSWFPQNGGAELVVLLVALAALLLRGKPLPERGALIQRSLGRAPRPRYMGSTTIVYAGLGLGALLFLEGKWREALIMSFVLGTITLSYVVVTGYAGQLSLAQLTLAGAAGYMLSFFQASWNLPYPAAPLLAALCTAGLGVMVGLPALRVRGLSLAVITFAFAVAIDAVWFRNTDIVGFSGGATIAEPTLFGLNFGWGFGRGESHISFGLFALVMLTMTAVAVGLLRRSRLGSAMVAVRANERSAAAVGVNVVRVKMLAFAISSFIAGIGGTMLAYRFGTITDTQFAPTLGLSLFLITYLAGITSVNGGVVAGFFGVSALIYTATNEWLSLGEWYNILSAGLVLVTIIANPEGVTSANHQLADWLHRRRVGRRGPRVQQAIARPPAPGDPVSTGPLDLTGRPHALESRDVTVRYGGVVAVDRVSDDIPEGAIVGLIGPNGAGKTTLVDALTGFVGYKGSVRIPQRALDALRPHQRVRLGVARTFQSIELYDDLTVMENLEVGMSSYPNRGRRARADQIGRATAVLGIEDLLDRPAGELSQGQRQLVSIGRALVSNPSVLLLDEPAAGLDSNESAWLGERLRGVRDHGVTILLVDHNVNLVLGLCDHVVVLNFGTVIAEGTPEQIRNDPAVVAAYLGGSTEVSAPSVESGP